MADGEWVESRGTMSRGTYYTALGITETATLVGQLVVLVNCRTIDRSLVCDPQLAHYSHVLQNPQTWGTPLQSLRYG